MTPDTQARIEQALQTKIVASRPVAGGDINEATRIELSDGRLAFVKSNLDAPKGMFPAEARGLSWLSEAKAIRTPEVYAVCRDEATGQAAYLVLEWIAPGHPGKQFDERLGQGLAKLHQAFAPKFGFDSDNFIGSLPQDNRECASWSEFFYSRRLEPQVRLAVNARRLDDSTARAFGKLATRLHDIFSVVEPPARLHGDLWGGNLHVDESGQPCLIDPAVYGGHREMDLGMMQLFGGFSAAVFDAYAEAYPLAAGFQDRVALTQLYPLLVHVNLFGGGYAASVKRVVQRYV
jgi:fructosamine-3-kinase